MNKEDYIGDFDSWGDVATYWLKEVKHKDIRVSSTSSVDFNKQLGSPFPEWVERNYNQNPRFTVKSDRKTAESDAIDRLTMHK